MNNSNQNIFSCSTDDKYGEYCLKTGAMLLGSICRHTTQLENCDVPLYFMELVSLIAKAFDHTVSQVRQMLESELFLLLCKFLHTRNLLWHVGAEQQAILKMI